MRATERTPGSQTPLPRMGSRASMIVRCWAVILILVGEAISAGPPVRMCKLCGVMGGSPIGDFGSPVGEYGCSFCIYLMVMRRADKSLIWVGG